MKVDTVIGLFATAEGQFSEREQIGYIEMWSYTVLVDTLWSARLTVRSGGGWRVHSVRYQRSQAEALAGILSNCRILGIPGEWPKPAGHETWLQLAEMIAAGFDAEALIVTLPLNRAQAS